MGRLSTEYHRASQAASAIDEALEQLHAQPVGQVQEYGDDLGRYLATVAGLMDPAYASEIDVEFAATVPKGLVSNLAAISDSDPELPGKLVETAKDLMADRKLRPAQVKLVEEVAEVATQDALQLTQEILTR